MKILVITNLFPNSIEPTRGVFNLQQLKALADTGVEAEVIAPVPWFPGVAIRKKWFEFSQIPQEETISGFRVYHPRYIVIPGILRSLYGLFFFLGIVRKVKELQKQFRFDCIFATWAYPDGFASALVARLLGVPLVTKVHGSDINVYTKYFVRRQMIRYGLGSSTRVIVVTESLRQAINALGIPDEKVCVIRNGVDSEKFTPQDRMRCRSQLSLGTEGKIITYIGNLVPIKGADFLLEAMGILTREKNDVSLVIVGDGDERTRLQERAKELEIDKKVLFAGRKAHEEIPLWLNAADVLCLPSVDEGCPNVILEALACGKPVVASDVGGVRELASSDDIGLLARPKDPAHLACMLGQALEKIWDPEKIRQESLKFNWKENARRLREALDGATSSYHGAAKATFKSRLKPVLARVVPNRMIVWRGRHHRGIALTFDDGPNPQITPHILEILKEKKVKATFFLIGKEIERHKELAERIAVEGHCVGMHSYTHRGFGRMDLERRQDEIARTRESLRHVMRTESSLFRPPQGSLTFSQILYCLKKRITTVLWSIDSRDVDCRSVQHILDNTIGNGIKNGDIVLLHDDNEFTLKALPMIIDYLKKRDFEFVTVEEVLR